MNIIYRGTAQQLRDRIRLLPLYLSGKAVDSFGVGVGVQLRVGVALLSQIQQAFIEKSRGGTGSDGITWPPLKRETIAQRRTTGQERKELGITGKRVRGLLTPAQDKRWRAIFASRLARLRFDMGEAEAKARAAQIAWAVLKSEGAKTKLEVLGGRKVDIGRDTSRMFRSFSPGMENIPSGEEEQIFDTPPGRIIVGSNVPYAGHFHRKRPFWPVDGSLPEPWAEAVAEAATEGIEDAVMVLVGGKS